MKRIPVLLNLAVAAAYILASEAVLGTLTLHGAPIVWFASAVGMAALLLYGPQVLPGVALGAMVCALLGGKAPAAAVGSAVVTAAQLWLAWWILVRAARFDPALLRVRDVLLLAGIGATVSPLLNALRSIVAAYWREGTLTARALGFTEFTTLGEVVGILLVLPALLAWARARQAEPLQPWRETILYALAFGVSAAVFGAVLGPVMRADSLPYALFPIALWAAFRFGVRPTASVLFIAGLTAIACHRMGEGPFTSRAIAADVEMANVASLYLFLAVLSATSLLLAAAERESAAAGDQLRESELKYRNLIDRMSEGVNITDAQRRMVFVSDRFCEMVGYAREELLGRTGEMLATAEEHGKWLHSHDRRESGAAEPHPLALRRRNGETLHAWISPKALFARDGAYEGSLNVVMDMTSHRQAEIALRESEEKYRLLVDNQTDLVAKVCAKTKRILYASPSHRAFFGAPEPYLEGQLVTMAYAVHEDDRDNMLAALAAVAHPPHVAATEARVMTTQGWRWLAWTGRAALDAQGNPDFIALVGRDVTDRRRAEEQARQHLQQLAHVSRVSSMGEMASAIAHEINQPLTAISNYTSACVRMLKSNRVTLEEAVDTMQRVAAEAQRAGEIVRKMRGFVRSEEGQLAGVEVNALVADVLRLAGPEAHQYDVELAWTPQEGLPKVLADSIQVQQVLLNLVRNASESIHSADCDVRRVSVSARRSADGAMIEITVRDSGPGIPPDQLDKVFEPFFTTKPDGIGIGLALSRSIIDAHGGRLWASADGGGAAFHLTLPVAEEAAHAEA